VYRTAGLGDGRHVDIAEHLEVALRTDTVGNAEGGAVPLCTHAMAAGLTKQRWHFVAFLALPLPAEPLNAG
jgi:hypothetical protein